MNGVIDCDKAGHPAASMSSTSPAKPGYLLATHAPTRVRGRHILVPEFSRLFGGDLA